MKPFWKNLSQNSCPMDGKPLVIMDVKAYCPCGFSISKERMEQLKYNMENGIFNHGRRQFEEGYG